VPGCQLRRFPPAGQPDEWTEPAGGEPREQRRHGEHGHRDDQAGPGVRRIDARGRSPRPVRVGRREPFAGERAPPEPPAVGDGEHAAGDEARQRGPAAAPGLKEGGVHLLLRHEPQQGWQPRQGQGRQSPRHRQGGHPGADPVEPAQIPGAGGVVHRADGEEHGRLGQPVRDQQHPRRGRGRRRPPPADADEEAQLADRGEGQHLLEVVGAQRPPATDEHGRHADRHEGGAPPRQGGERGGQPQHEVHPGLDHGRRVQVGADRGRRGHRRG